MPRFRKKPILVEAEQYLHPATAPHGVRTEEDGRAYVVTIHKQKVYLEAGDWILPEPDGEHFYPVKNVIFAATYEPADGPGESPGAAWSDVAASAYRAYAASTGNKNFRGDPMPAWFNLPQAIRTAWEAAVRQAGSVLNGGSYGLDIEQRWSGWNPPV